MRHYSGIDDLKAAVGAPALVSSWHVIDQDRIDKFADATDDHQWIHVDIERAAAGPFHGTIAHGYLSLSLISSLLFETATFVGEPTIINYGLDKVRFPAPVPVGSRVRGLIEVTDVTETPNGARLSQRVTIEIEGAQKPAVVAETLSLVVFG
ncbi:MAG TPA: MaoC family dehydratase [Galbitalea sp.]|jgi:acyl dehydratase